VGEAEQGLSWLRECGSWRPIRRRFCAPGSTQRRRARVAEPHTFPHINLFGVRRRESRPLLLASELKRPRRAALWTRRSRPRRAIRVPIAAGSRFAEALVDCGSWCGARCRAVAMDARAGRRRPRILSDTDRVHVPEGLNPLIDDRQFLWFGPRRRAARPAVVRRDDRAPGVREPCTPEEAWTTLHGDPQSERTAQGMTRPEFDELVARIREMGWRVPRPPPVRRGPRSTRRAQERTRAHPRGVIEAGRPSSSARSFPKPGTRAAVVPVNDDHNMAPLSLGSSSPTRGISRTAAAGALRLRSVVPHRRRRCSCNGPADRPSSCSRTTSGTTSATFAVGARERGESAQHHDSRRPEHAEVHAELRGLLAEHPHVDSPSRRGEATFAPCFDALDPGALGDLSNLSDVAGLSFRDPSGVVHTPDRDRIAELDTIPSPYLLGLFEPFGRAHVAASSSRPRLPVRLHVLRLGVATLSRVRKFDMEPGQGRARVVLEERVDVRLAL